MSISIYDPSLWDDKVPANVLGGRNRAKSAIRDVQGRFLPRDEFLASMRQPDPQHGVPGGQKRAATGQRVNGRYVKATLPN